ncbi:hypothetical protein D0Z00_001230 [Geotrichum galactomycetum]|uniref:Uncharacterized protein n=1 Tax=Geotrichum galactomycetum TaxID=27317 RepID=A0ACB6V7P7_9ASCO|nr:hypothetical protein D0Z00_001230 [Geotrichum candidum]
MVKITPIQEDEAAAFFEESAAAAANTATEEKVEDNEADYTDTDDNSESDNNNDEEEDDEDDDEEDISNETIAERIIALKQAIPPSYRHSLENVSSSVSSVVKTSATFAGNAFWVVITSSLLLGVPLALSIISEQQLIEMEREMKLTQSTNEVSN